MASDKIPALSSSSLHTSDFDMEGIENMPLLSAAEMETFATITLPITLEMEGVHISTRPETSLESEEVSNAQVP